MNQKNYEYLRDQLLYSGFGDTMNANLQKAMKKGQDQFTLNFKREDEAERIAAQLRFSKSKQSDMYFFNSYELKITNRASLQSIKQQFYVNGRDRFTLKEAYNLLHGRAVHKDLTNKEGERYRAWVQLDFKTVDLEGNRKFRHYHENYGFDLPRELEKFPISDLQYPDSKEYLIASLERGNRHDVTFMLEQGSRQVSLEANPKFKSVAIYDGSMRLEFVSMNLDKHGQQSAQDVQVENKQKLQVDQQPPAKQSKGKRL